MEVRPGEAPVVEGRHGVLEDAIELDEGVAEVAGGGRLWWGEWRGLLRDHGPAVHEAHGVLDGDGLEDGGEGVVALLEPAGLPSTGQDDHDAVVHGVRHVTAGLPGRTGEPRVVADVEVLQDKRLPLADPASAAVTAPGFGRSSWRCS